MSDFTTAMLYRPGPPPVVTTGSLADFLEQMELLDLLESKDYVSVGLKFGKAIDQDHKTIFTLDDPEALVTFARPMKMDAKLDRASLYEVIDWLRSPLREARLFARPKRDQGIYRASVILWAALKDHIREQICREDSEDYGSMFYDMLSLSIEPQTIYVPETECDGCFVGWMSVSFSGQCSLFPWTYEDALGRMKACEPIQQLRDLCCSFWPVPPIPVTEEMIATRRAAGRLWQEEDYSAPSDWRWAINSSY